MLILVVIEERERVRERANPMWSSKEKKNVLKKPKRIGPSQKRQCFKKHEKLLIISSSDEFEDLKINYNNSGEREREKKKVGLFSVSARYVFSQTVWFDVTSDDSHLLRQC